MKQPIKPPFTEETAPAKVTAAEDAWNSRDPELWAVVVAPWVLVQERVR